MSELLEVRFTGELQRCDVRPGDRFVLTVGHSITKDEAGRIQEWWKCFIGGDDVRLLVVDHNATLTRLSSGESS